MDHRDHCGLLEVEVDRFARVLDVTDRSVQVPTCPEWTVEDLARHLGRVHRWAESLVRALSEKPTRQPLTDEPVTPEWIRRGGRTLSDALRSADPDAPMWAWGADHHVRFWSRRQLHETLVHRMDLELLGGRRPDVAPEVAADAVDELLVNLRSAAAFSPGIRRLCGHGEQLEVRPDDLEVGWTITLIPDGFTVERHLAAAGRPAPAATLGGHAADLLAVLYRRTSLDNGRTTVEGARPLVDFWLDSSALG